MDSKTPEQLLKELDEEGQIVLKYIQLQRKRAKKEGASKNGKPQTKPIANSNENTSVYRTGLKEAIFAFLQEHSEQGRHQIANGIVDKLEGETVETLLPKVSNVLSTDKDLNVPKFKWKFKHGSKRDKVWSLA